MPDTLIQIGRSLIQHGPFSDRIYVMEIHPDDMPEILDELDALANREGYGKIFAKTRRTHSREFLNRGYQQEAMIPGFFSPSEDCVLMGKFLTEARARETAPGRVKKVLEVAQSERRAEDQVEEEDTRDPPDPELRVTFREADPSDVQALADCYASIFQSYPFPIHDPDHLQAEMEEGTRFFTAWEGGRLVATSSMERGGADGTVEMTDFATLPDYRGRGLATQLLTLMDQVARASDQRVAYTIARAVSFGMNITFARRAYTFGGTLVSNTQIGGAIESMNVWYKVLT